MTKNTTMILDGRDIVKVTRGGRRNVEVRFDHGPRFGERVVVEAARLTPSFRTATPDEIHPQAELWAITSRGGRISVTVENFLLDGTVRVFDSLRCERYQLRQVDLYVDDAARIRDSQED